MVDSTSLISLLILALLPIVVVGNDQRNHNQIVVNQHSSTSSLPLRQERAHLDQTTAKSQHHVLHDGTEGSVRHLKGPPNTLPFTAPTRRCGQVIAQLSIPELQALASAFVAVLPLGDFAALAQTLISSTFKYPVHVQKICSSCKKVASSYRGQSFLNDKSPYGFATFCGKRRYGYDVTTSGLLLAPIDPATGKIITGTLRSGVFTHGTTSGSQLAPSGVFPSNVTDFLQGNATVLAQRLVGQLIDSIAALFAASAGAVSVLPDNIGYGESYKYPKSYLVYSLYQQASITMWLEARRALSSVSSSNAPCTALDTAVSISGYSEGGYAAFATCLALNQLKIGGSKLRILRCQCGGTPFDLDYLISFTLKQIKNNTAQVNAPAVTAFFGNSYSSTNPDLANSYRNQDGLAKPFRRVVPTWLDLPSLRAVVQLIVDAGPFNILNPSLVDVYIGGQVSLTPTRSCSGPGLKRKDTRFLCKAIVDNSLVNPLLQADFQTIVCHAPDDHLVPFGNIPNFSSNPNVQFYRPLVPQLAPIGNHLGGNIFCTIGTILAFAQPTNVSDSLQLMSNQTDASACKVVGTVENGRPKEGAKLKAKSSKSGLSRKPKGKSRKLHYDS